MKKREKSYCEGRRTHDLDFKGFEK